MYYPRTKTNKPNCPFPFPSYVVKSYTNETPEAITGLKINTQKIRKDFQSEGKFEDKHNKSENSQKFIRKNNYSSQALDQIYTMICANSYEPFVRSP